MIVLDASAAAELVLDTRLGQRVADRLRGEALHGPAHFDVEVVGVIRKAVLRQVVSDRDGMLAVRAFKEMPVRRWPIPPLLDRAYALRATHTVADAVYVALAEALTARLLTCDERLARSHGHRAQIGLPE